MLGLMDNNKKYGGLLDVIFFCTSQTLRKRSVETRHGWFIHAAYMSDPLCALDGTFDYQFFFVIFLGHATSIVHVSFLSTSSERNIQIRHHQYPWCPQEDQPFHSPRSCHFQPFSTSRSSQTTPFTPLRNNPTPTLASLILPL